MDQTHGDAHLNTVSFTGELETLRKSQDQYWVEQHKDSRLYSVRYMFFHLCDIPRDCIVVSGGGVCQSIRPIVNCYLKAVTHGVDHSQRIFAIASFYSATVLPFFQDTAHIRRRCMQHTPLVAFRQLGGPLFVLAMFSVDLFGVLCWRL